MSRVNNQEKSIYEGQRQTKPKYVFKFNTKIRKVKGEYKVSYVLNIFDKNSDRSILVMTLRNWYPVIDYLISDERYIRERDYIVVKKEKITKAGKVDLIEVNFPNPECARRVTVFVLSILGVENKSSWVNKMMHVVRKLSPEAIDFWLQTAYDRFIVSKNGLTKRFRLLRVAKAMRTLYERNTIEGVL